MTGMSMQGCIRETELLNTVAYIMLTRLYLPCDMCHRLSKLSTKTYILKSNLSRRFGI